MVVTVHNDSKNVKAYISGVSSYLPKILNHVVVPVNVNTANIHLYCLKNVILNTQSSHFIAENNQVIMERLADAELKYCNYSTGYMKGHNIYHARS